MWEGSAQSLTPARGATRGAWGPRRRRWGRQPQNHLRRMAWRGIGPRSTRFHPKATKGPKHGTKCRAAPGRSFGGTGPGSGLRAARKLVRRDAATGSLGPTPLGMQMPRPRPSPLEPGAQRRGPAIRVLGSPPGNSDVNTGLGVSAPRVPGLRGLQAPDPSGCPGSRHRRLFQKHCLLPFQ